MLECWLRRLRSHIVYLTRFSNITENIFRCWHPLFLTSSFPQFQRLSKGDHRHLGVQIKPRLLHQNFSLSLPQRHEIKAAIIRESGQFVKINLGKCGFLGTSLFDLIGHFKYRWTCILIHKAGFGFSNFSCWNFFVICDLSFGA